MDSSGPPPKRLFQCDQCNMCFARKSSLTKHFRTHTGERPYVCKTCGQKFTQSSNLYQHRKTHLALDCDVCEDRFCSLSALERHKKSHHEKLRCSECHYSTHLKANLERHLLTHSGEQPHHCELCDKAFTCKEHLKKHRLVHAEERPYHCDTCGIGFRDESTLHSHEVTSRGECHREGHIESHQMFRCTQCPYYSAHKVLLTRHLLTHSGERPHRCELCGKAFIQKHNLKMHLLVHTGEKPYVCDTCGKGFCFKSSFKYHKWTHSGPHPCDACGNHFGSSVDRNVLKCSRAMGHPNVCPHCHFGTRSAFGLRQHIQKVHAKDSIQRKHSQDSKHSCSFCRAVFSSPLELQRHVKKLHLVKEEKETVDVVKKEMEVD